MGCLESKDGDPSREDPSDRKKNAKNSAEDREMKKWSYNYGDDKWKVPKKEDFLARFNGDKETMLEFLNVNELNNDVKVYRTGELDGYDVTFKGCVNTDVYILDITSQVQIDDCSNCRFFIAPCSGSVFIRDCTNLRVAVCTSQLRLRDCIDCTLMVFVRRRSVLEACKRISLCRWNVGYFQLSRQMSRSSLSVFDNGWNSFDDFGTNCRPNFLPLSTTLETIMKFDVKGKGSPEGETLAVDGGGGEGDSVTSSVLHNNDVVSNIQWRPLEEIDPAEFSDGCRMELNPIPITTGNRTPENQLFMLFSPRCGEAARAVAAKFSNLPETSGPHLAAMREFGPVPPGNLDKLVKGISLMQSGPRKALYGKGPLIGLLATSADTSADLAAIVQQVLSEHDLCVAQCSGEATRGDAPLDKGQVCLWKGPAAKEQAVLFIDEIRGALDG